MSGEHKTGDGADGEFDIVVMGATGFTGRLVTEYLWTRQVKGEQEQVQWAVAGRNEGKLRKVVEEVVAETEGSGSIPIIVADANSEADMDMLARRARVVLSTAGPYTIFGRKLLQACANRGTHYCDLTGEMNWVADMIEEFGDVAKERKARIINSAAFDCIPADLGAQFAAETFQRAHAKPPASIKWIMTKNSGGGPSGGTMASALAAVEAMKKPPTPLDLVPKELAVKRPRAHVANLFGYDRDVGRGVFMWPLGLGDSMVVHRSNALLGYPYGEQLQYTEYAAAPRGAMGMAFAVVVGLFMAVLGALMYIPFTRPIVRAFAPKSGEGPSKEVRDRGYFEITLIAKGTSDTGEAVQTRSVISAHAGDAGYKGTALMISETALCLALNEDKLPNTFGFLTPAACMGHVLRDRLEQTGTWAFKAV